MRDPRAEAAGEQGEYCDPLFTYREGDEASYFTVSEESGAVSYTHLTLPTIYSV